MSNKMIRSGIAFCAASWGRVFVRRFRGISLVGTGVTLGAVLVPMWQGEPLARTEEEYAWNPLPASPQSVAGRHDDVTFVSSTVGWSVNGNGDVFKTTDGGVTWFQQLHAVDAVGDEIMLRTVAFADQKLGWVGALTGDKLLFETQDGGKSWKDVTRRISGEGVAGICGLWAVDSAVVYGVGRYFGPAHMIKSVDGGLTWQARPMSDHAGTLVDVMFFDRERGFAIGGSTEEFETMRVVVLETNNGGHSWVRRYTGVAAGEIGWKMTWPTERVGYVSVESSGGAKILKTDDGGKTWRASLIDDHEPLQGIGFLTPDLGWISGRGQASETRDGGVSWRPAPGLGGRVNVITVVNDTLAYAAGRRIFKYARQY